MPLSVDGILFDELSSDPGSPAEGQMWYNTTDHIYKIYRNGAVNYFTDYATFSAHSTNTSNPHQTTFEQARTAGSTLAGSFSMGGFAITSLGAGSAGTDAAQRQWVTDQINSKVKGLDWQDPVINSQTTPPVPTPSEGDRYRITSVAQGVWAGKEDQIATWTSGAWVYTTPIEGFILRDMTSNTYIVYDGSGWGNLGNTVDHNSLLNLATGDYHTQYQLRSEKNANSGYCGLTAGGTIDDTRHGSRSGGSLHSLTSSSGHGFAPQSKFNATADPTVNDDGTAGYVVGSQWINVSNKTDWICLDNSTGAAVWKETTNTASVLASKSGSVLAASFAGNPKKATVTFSTAFADANYAVTVTAVTVNNITHIPVVESQLAGSFVIDMGANNIANLTKVNWIAVKHGESA